MGQDMENDNNRENTIAPSEIKPIKVNQSFLVLETIPVTDKIHIRIPKVNEVLQNETGYYGVTSSLVANPMTYAIQLEDEGIHNWDTMSDYDLFVNIFQKYIMRLNILDERIDIDKSFVNEKVIEDILQVKSTLSLIFGDLDISGFRYLKNNDESERSGIFYNPFIGAVINENIYKQIADIIRSINLYEHNKSRPANESFKKYFLKKERRRAKRRRNNKYKPFLEPLIHAMVNNKGFKYDYEGALKLPLYTFNQCYKQIQHDINFENVMHGVCAGTIDTSKMADKSALSWVLTR